MEWSLSEWVGSSRYGRDHGEYWTGHILEGRPCTVDYGAWPMGMGVAFMGWDGAWSWRYLTGYIPEGGALLHGWIIGTWLHRMNVWWGLGGNRLGYIPSQVDYGKCPYRTEV